jgi:hypothetical protein
MDETYPDILDSKEKISATKVELDEYIIKIRAKYKLPRAVYRHLNQVVFFFFHLGFFFFFFFFPQNTLTYEMIQGSTKGHNFEYMIELSKAGDAHLKILK